MSRDHLVIENCDAIGDWTILSDDTGSLAASTNRLVGTGSISFAKLNGTANTVYAGAYKTLVAGDWFREGGGFLPEDRIGISFYVSATTNVAGGFVRIGTSGSNYLEWLMPDVLAGWNTVSVKLGNAYLGGTGAALWNVKPSELVYMAVGVKFDAETNTLAGVLVDNVFLDKNVKTIS